MSGRWTGVALGLLLGLTGMLALAVGADVEEDLGLQWLFAARGPVEPPDDVIIIAIDTSSARSLGLPEKPRDWPRTLHAQLVRYLATAGASVVSFDLTFDHPSAGAGSTNDQQFAAAMGLAGNVLVTDSVRKEIVRLGDPRGGGAASAVIERPVPPIGPIEQAALAHAPFLLPRSARVNAYWTFLSAAGNTPTIPVLALHFFAGSALNDFTALLGEVSHDEAIADPGLSAADTRLAQARALRSRVARIPNARQELLRRLDAVSQTSLPMPKRRLVASLVRLYSSADMAYLNFYGPSRHIRTVAYSQVLESAQGTSKANPPDQELFRNKAVFIGYSASGDGVDSLHDDYPTVYSEANGRDISGVEIQATAFANALQGRVLEPAPPLWRLAAVGAWGLLLGALCSFVRPVRATAAVLALSALVLWVVYRQFVDAGVWWPSIVPIGVQAPLALFAGMWFNYQETKQEREAVKRAFARFLPSAVVEQLARNVGAVTATNRVVFGACLATDAEKYTTLAEQTEPGKLGELMNAYYADLFVPVERSGGVVIDIVGDAMVAVWAGALSQDALRRSACESALEIVEGLDRVGDGRLVLPTRLGLHSGEMLIGSLGASRHFEYRAVGDIVNTASRIQALNKILGTRLLASQTTVEGFDHLALRPLGSFLLPGKRTPVPVVELVGRAEEMSPRQREDLDAFARALADYRAGSWQDAATQLQAILQRLPHDGPSRFYFERCTRLLDNPAKADWSPTIRIGDANQQVGETST